MCVTLKIFLKSVAVFVNGNRTCSLLNALYWILIMSSIIFIIIITVRFSIESGLTYSIAKFFFDKKILFVETILLKE